MHIIFILFIISYLLLIVFLSLFKKIQELFFCFLHFFWKTCFFFVFFLLHKLIILLLLLLFLIIFSISMLIFILLLNMFLIILLLQLKRIQMVRNFELSIFYYLLFSWILRILWILNISIIIKNACIVTLYYKYYFPISSYIFIKWSTAGSTYPSKFNLFTIL